jgi:predicted nucleotidyltransferase
MGSDLDPLVEIDDPKMGLLKFIARENYLSDLLGVKVDNGGKASPQARHRPSCD